MPEVFLSYSREDQAVARRFAEGLQRAGFSVWWDQALNPGEAFDQVTEQALDEARAVIVLWSKASVSSRWVRAEATQANAAGRLLPVMVESCKRPIMFELTHTAELSGWQGNTEDAAWQDFVAGVRRFVQRGLVADAGLSAPRAQPLPPPPRPSLKQRLAVALSMLQGAAVRFGLLLRRFGGRLAFGLICAALAGFIAWRVHPRPTPQVTRFSFELRDTYLTGRQSGLAISPDGQRIVYASSVQARLYSRRLEADESTPIPGTENGFGPFFSPDGHSVAYYYMTANRLKASDFSTVRELVNFNKSFAGLIGTWDDQGRIFYGLQASPPLGLSRVAGRGGVPERFAELGDYQSLQFPEALPGGKWVLFAARKGGSWSEADIVAQNVASGERKVLPLAGGYFPRYLPTGHLLFMRGSTLYAVAFDARRIAVRGGEVPVEYNISADTDTGYAMYAVSATGTLVYAPGSGTSGATAINSIVRVGRDGQVRPLSPERRAYHNLRASPDGSKIAVEVTGDDGQTHIWVMDILKGTPPTQLTFDGEEDRYPVWAGNREVLYTSKRGTEYAIYRRATDDMGTERLVHHGVSGHLAPSDVYRNTLLYQDNGKDGQRDIFALDLADEAKPPRTVLDAVADESSARFSPDGKWIAYVAAPVGSDAASYRVYARPYQNAAEGSQRAISDGDAVDPAWCTRGNESFICYLSLANGQLDSLWSARVEVTPAAITPMERPHEVFPFVPRFVAEAVRDYAKSYDLLPDGSFVVVANGAATSADAGSANRARANVVVNWAEELKKRVPVE